MIEERRAIRGKREQGWTRKDGIRDRKRRRGGDMKRKLGGREGKKWGGGQDKEPGKDVRR